MPAKTIYTKDVLNSVVVVSSSVAEVLRRLEMKPTGNNHSFISRKIRSYGIETSHFLGKKTNLGGRINATKLSPDELLVLKVYGNRTAAVQLRRALIESGRPYRCEVCHLGPLWNGQELRLQVDHKNGNFLDNRSCNLRFICPNCHTQTPNFGYSKLRTGVTSYNHYNPDKYKQGKHRYKDLRRKLKNTCKCGALITDRAKRCEICYHTDQEKIDWPDDLKLIQMVRSTSYTAVAKQLGVSDKAVAKRLKNRKQLTD